MYDIIFTRHRISTRKKKDTLTVDGSSLNNAIVLYRSIETYRVGTECCRRFRECI